MDVFISWSGSRSKAAAEALRSWIPQLINAVTPYLSSQDISAGARWASDVSAKLSTARVGIICLTPSNLKAEWILFEAGALSKTLENSFVCTLLIGIEPGTIVGPLSQFQASEANRNGIRRILSTINSASGQPLRGDQDLDSAFDVWWPKLEERLNNLPPEDAAKPEYDQRAVLEEIRSGIKSLAAATFRKKNLRNARLTSSQDGPRILNVRDATQMVLGEIQNDYPMVAMSDAETFNNGWEVGVFMPNASPVPHFKLIVPRAYSYALAREYVRFQLDRLIKKAKESGPAPADTDPQTP